MKNLKCLLISLIFALYFSVPAFSENKPLFDMQEMYDESSLDVKVISDWKVVDNGDVKTRQKVIEILVGKVGTGYPLRVPVRMVVPEKNKAKGFNLTAGFGPKDTKKDLRITGLNAEFIKGNVGIVMTAISAGYPSGEEQKKWNDHFTKNLDARSSTGFWIWPATLMRAITAAYAEKGHFEKGKIAMSGRSKTGASPTAVLVVDKRTTALHAAASPIAESPARLLDEEAMRKINAYQSSHKPAPLSSAARKAAKLKRQEKKTKGKKKGTAVVPAAPLLPLDQVVSPKPYDRNALGELKPIPHFALGGTFGLNFAKQAIGHGNSWEKVRQFATRLAPELFVSMNLEQLKQRNVDMLFHPGTHDYICWDVPSVGANYPQIPVYLRVNTSHSSKDKRDIDPNENNKNAFLYNHFFGGEPLLTPPTINCRQEGKKLTITVKFAEGSKEESGHLYWMYDRAPDGSDNYLKVKFPQEHMKTMIKSGDSWTTTIDLKEGQSSIDLFTTHRKTIQCGSETYKTYLSSPYKRVDFAK